MTSIASQYHRILVPVDFSKLSLHALPIAQKLADEPQGELHLLHVNQPSIAYAHVGGPSAPTPITAPTVGPTLEELQAQLAEDSAGVSLGSGKVIRSVIEGDPTLAIVDYAKKHDIDLIVITTHGHTGLTRLLVGSVAEKVVRTAPCGVLVLKAKSEEE